MPELKHNFMKGRMNKDLDERLVPNGEYRDALNIEVLTSESGDIGSVQNCLGNTQLTTVTEGLVVPRGVFGLNGYSPTCIGSIVDNKNNDVYWLVAGTPPIAWRLTRQLQGLESTNPVHKISRDFIARYNSDTTRQDIILNDIYNVRNDITNIWQGPRQIEVESIEGLRVGMELQISWSPPLGSLLAWNQTATQIIITNLNPTGLPPATSPGIIEVNQIPVGTNLSGTLIPFDNQHLQVPDATMRVNFVAPRVLNFDRDRLITGINVVDDMLFWTDNHTEPKKININRCYAGTPQSINAYGNFWHSHTKLMVGLTPNVLTDRGPIEEKHITNIKRAPLSPPTLEMSGEIERLDRWGNVHSTSSQHLNTENLFYGNVSVAGYGLYPEGTTTGEVAAWGNTHMMDLDWHDRVDWRKGDIILLTQNYDAAFHHTVPPTPRRFSGDDVKIKLLVTNSDSNAINPDEVWTTHSGGGNLAFEILAIDQDIPDCDNDPSTSKPPCDPWYMILDSGSPIYEFKFPKFGYRYKYEDGEYSTFSPFSELAFLPDRFSYHPKEGYNLGMVNHLRTLRVKDFIPKDMPLDVVEVDLLYKESNSPNIYTVKTFNSTMPEWHAVGSYSWDRSQQTPLQIPGGHYGNFEVKSDLIHAVVESNQLLRPWDNVPRKAVAQELTANRIIYGNYLQNYDIPSDPGFDVVINTDAATPEDLGAGLTPIGVYQFATGAHGVATREPMKSLKSLRTYQMGVVYKDFYGRETPVLSDYSNAIILEKQFANRSNRLQVKINSDAPSWADSFKYYVKETSNEYYNLSLDRWYDAGDENIWLSFPSEDRNKVDDETVIILKKGDRRDDFVEEAPKYKILAIENEAPDYVKTVYTSLGFIYMNTGINDNPTDVHGHFGGWGNGPGGYGPFVGRKNVRINGYVWDRSDLSSLQNPRNTILEGSFNERGTSLVIRFLNGEPGETSHQANKATKASKWYNISNIAAMHDLDVSSQDIDPWTSPKHYGINIDPDEHDGGFGEDILFLSGGDPADATNSPLAPSPGTGNIIDNIHIEIGRKTLENKPEFDGRFFVKIHDDISIQGSIKQDTASISTSSLLSENGSVQLNYFRGPDTFGTLHDSAAVNALNVPQGTSSAHNTQWSLTDTIFVDSSIQTPNYNTNGGVTAYPPNSFAHPDSTVLNEPIKGYIGATPIYPQGMSYLQFWEIYWEEEKGATPSLPAIPTMYYGNMIYTIPGPPMEPISTKTHRYPGSKLGHDDGTSSANPQSAGNLTLTSSIGSQALLPTPYRTDTEWSALIQTINSNTSTPNFNGWFIDSEPALAGLSQGVGVGLGTGGQDIKSFRLMKTVGADIGQSTIDISYTGMSQFGTLPSVANIIANKLVAGQKFQFTADPENIMYEIGSVAKFYVYNFDWVDRTTWTVDHGQFNTNSYFRRVIYRLDLVEPGTNNPKTIGQGSTGDPALFEVYSPVGAHSVSGISPAPAQADETNTCSISFFKTHEYHQKTIMPTNPAIFETEPKEDVGLDIYYEISKSYPVVMNEKSNERYIPINSHTDMYNCPHSPTGHDIVCGASPPICPKIIAINTNILNPLFGNYPTTEITWDVPQKLGAGDVLVFTLPDGTSVTATVAFDSGYPGLYGPSVSVFLDSNVHGEEHMEGWNNCYSFGNGVESNRIRDLYNTVTIDKGVKASTTIAEQYKEERRGSGLIFSGIYNSKMKGVNRLNQFIMAEPITKELNPTYGSIQKLHQRDADLITLCEDKVLRIDQRQSGKDALYNAEGNPSVTATSNVLGQTIPYLGDYGISKNPESFASEAFRFYFADKQRGAVLRLSRDGLTPISSYGMKDYFNKYLEFADMIIGSYDTVKSLYNISFFSKPSKAEHLHSAYKDADTLATIPVGNKVLTITDFLKSHPTISFRDQNNGWTSFKSFRPETGLSLNNKYYTTNMGELWEHHAHAAHRGRHYYRNYESTVTVLFNDSPSSVKSFTTLNYEGSQARVMENLNDGGDSIWANQYYNNTRKEGWYCKNITTINEVTGNQTGTVKEFINKEGKWFNHIQGEETTWVDDINGGSGNVDTQEFSVQGIGNLARPIIESDDPETPPL